MAGSVLSRDEFYQELSKLPRETLLELVEQQDHRLIQHVNRIEYVFANKLKHLTWPDGTRIEGRPVTNLELAYLIDPPFEIEPELTEIGMTPEQQYRAHIASDPVMWARDYLGVKPRAYQIWILRDPSSRKVLRAGRRLGKSWSMAVYMLHWAFTKKKNNVLVMAPMMPHVALLYKAVLDLVEERPEVANTIVRKVASPQHKIEFSNGSQISFFTTGMRSGGKGDVARGQEADLIVLDELDYMGPDDLDAIYVMLQDTDLEIGETKPKGGEKSLIGASTPTGLRGKFWEWSLDSRFKEFWFPSFVNPSFSKEVEDEFREQYDETTFRHEIEADWGESADGVYPRRYVDAAFMSHVTMDQSTETMDPVELKKLSDWDYKNPSWLGSDSKFLMGVDWDKYGAGPNICIIEIPGQSNTDHRFKDRIRIVFREEIKRSEFVLLEAVQRIVQLNKLFKPEWIYVDRGYGETQVELLHQHGKENPSSGLDKKVKGIAFKSSIEVRDPATKKIEKKPAKPFMVENVRWILERGMLAIPSSDRELYDQLSNYIVYGMSSYGEPKFQMADPQMHDHAHDALMLACLAYKQNYDALMKVKVASKSVTMPNRSILPPLIGETEDDIVAKRLAGKQNRRTYDSNGREINKMKTRGRSMVRTLKRGDKMNRKMF